MQKTDLSVYQNKEYNPGGSGLKRLLWFYVNAIIFKTSLIPSSRVKRGLLRLFGASVAGTVVIKPNVNIKYPWNLAIGPHTWVGENVWIDSLVMINIGAHVCISQGATLLTGSHNYKQKTFDLITGSVIIEDGAWIGACAVVNQGITIASHAVLTGGSVATKNLDAYGIYQGNPAIWVRNRQIS